MFCVFHLFIVKARSDAGLRKIIKILIFSKKCVFKANKNLRELLDSFRGSSETISYQLFSAITTNSGAMQLGNQSLSIYAIFFAVFYFWCPFTTQ